MTPRHFWIAVVALGSALAGASGLADATRANNDVPPSNVPPSKLFLQLDTNRDGYVSRGEAAKVRGIEQAFADADDNRDGKLSAGEFVKAESIYQRQQMAEFANDSVITAKVKAALIKDLELKAFDVGVATNQGRVRLSGFVEDRQQAQRAAQLASAVRGVERVQNGLKLK